MEPTIPPAKSIFEYLTTQNPKVIHPEPTSKSLSNSPKWFFPAQVTRWGDFNFETFAAIERGVLIDEARRMDRPPLSYSAISQKYDCVVADESATTRLLDRWNEVIVRTALLSVRHTLHPSIWVSGVRRQEKQEGGERQLEIALSRRAKRKQPPRKKPHRVNKSKKTSLSRLRPDSGAISHDAPLYPEGSPDHPLSRERFPKEYKTASKWKSECIEAGDLFDSNGEWRDGALNKNNAMPIKQAYTYCVTYGCRYGCILTCGEAFIFRVRPRAQLPG